MEKQGGTEAATQPAQSERLLALVDLLYLNQVAFLYLFSAIYPLMGLFYGTLYFVGSLSPKAKRTGRTCLILGIINLALMLTAGVVLLTLALTGALASLIGNN